MAVMLDGMKLCRVLLFGLIPALSCFSQPKDHWVDLIWDASTSKNVTSYNIYRRSQSSTSWVKIGSTKETKFADHQVKPREKYVYKVCGMAEGIEGTCTKEVKAEIPRK